MKKHLMILALAATVVAPLFGENTAVGSYALSGASYSVDNAAFGVSAGRDIDYADGNLFLGDNAGFGIYDGNGNIAIGRGALRSAWYVDGTVAIGENELMGANYNSDTTSINGQQIWVSQPANAFSICPTKNDSLTNSPLYYIGGTLYLNADEIVTKGGIIGGGGSSYAADGYDFYVSETGRDENSGRDWRHPKRTIEAVWTAAGQIANQTNFTCAVYAGTHYLYVAHSEKGIRDNGVYGVNDKYSKRVTFTAVEGPEKTVLSGPEGNLERQDTQFINICLSLGDTWNNTKPDNDYGPCSGGISSGYVWRRQTFDGFQVVNFASTQSGSATTKTAPIFCGIRFINCDIHHNFMWQSGVYGAVGMCDFINCTIHDNILQHTGGSGDAKSCLYQNCRFEGTKVVEDGFGRPSGWNGPYYWFRYGFRAKNSAFKLTADDAHTAFWSVSQSEKNGITNCTFVIGCYSNNLQLAATDYFYTNYAFNCYANIGNGTTLPEGSLDAQQNLSGVWSNALLNAELVAYSLDCPTIRTDGRVDCGWKDSGLSGRKALQIIASRPQFYVIGGSLYVYTNGVIAGSVALASVASQQTSSLPRHMSWSAASETEPERTPVLDEPDWNYPTNTVWTYQTGD